MYQNIYYDRFNEVMHLWDDIEGYFKFKYEPYAYITDSNGEWTTLSGETVRKITTWDDALIQSGNVFEHDIRPEVRTLIDVYGSSDEISTNHCIMYIDIEVAKEVRYSTPEDAFNQIISICAFDTRNNMMNLFVLEKAQYSKLNDIQRDGVNIFKYNTELDLMNGFIEYYRACEITIITGWNIIGYDLKYLYNRSERLFGKWGGGWLSPINKVKHYTNKINEDVFIIAGVAVLDYLKLYKTLTTVELPSYNLDAVSHHELGRGKIKYEGTLQELYESNIDKFIQYNIEDVQLVIDLNLKLDYIAIAQGVCHKGHVPYDDIYHTSRYMDGACITEAKRKNLVVTNVGRGGYGEDKAEGALVKTTKPGRYSWIYDLDLRALYPSNIITLNISPETKRGKILNWNSYDFVADKTTTYEMVYLQDNKYNTYEIPSSDIKKLLIDNSLCVAANGMVYTTSEIGLIPSILKKWAVERAEYRHESDRYHAAGDTVMSNYFDRKQKIQKVLLNSLYGVLLLPTFRFYDKDNGEAVTLTGQQLITFTQTMMNHRYNEICGTNGIDYCIYSDTDSIFFEALPILNSRNIEYTDDTIADLCISVATEFQNYINEQYSIYATEFHMVLNTHEWVIKQELIAKRAFWGNVKKRYAMWLVRDGKKIIDKFDIKGFDSVRSNFPKVFRKFLEAVIHGILQDKTKNELVDSICDIRDDMNSFDVYSIMNPTSVNKLESYLLNNGSFKLGAPIHVKAALNYNKLLGKLDINNSAPIYSGDKILWCYLTKNPYMMDVIALKGYDDDPRIIEFIDKYIFRDKIFDKALTLKIQSIWDSLGWGQLDLNRNTAKIFEQLE